MFNSLTYLISPFLFTLSAATFVAGATPAPTAPPAVVVPDDVAVARIAPAATSRQIEWLRATPDQRVRLAQQLGEDGAETFARSKGLTPVLRMMSFS